MNRHEDTLAATRHLLMVATALLVVASSLSSQYLTEAFNAPTPPPGAGGWYLPIAADLNQNGYADLIYLPGAPSMFEVDLDPAVSGVGPNLMQAYSTTGAGNGGHGAAADVNGDGLVDLVYDRLNPPNPSGFISTIHVNLGNGNGTFVPASAASITMSTPASMLYWLAVTDVNNDSLPDVLTYSSSGPYSPTLSCYINQFPTWSLTWQVPLGASGGVNVNTWGGAPRVGDFDGDGNADLALQHTSAYGPGATWVTEVLWGSGTGQFSALNGLSISGFSVFPGVAIAGLMDAADMNGDGVTDLISSVPTTIGGANTELLQVYLGAPTRTLVPAGTFTTPPMGGLPATTIAADFNRDGFGDLLRGPAAASYVSPAVCNFSVTMALGLPGGQLQQVGMSTTHLPCSTPTYCPNSLVADFDGDCDLDLVCTPNFCPLYYFRNSALTGSGCAGSSVSPPGLQPGNAQVGNASFGAALSGAPGNALAVLAIATGLSSSPLNTCGVYLDLAGPVVYLPGAADSFGNAAWQLPIPANPLLHGATFRAQAAVLDPLGPNLGGLNLALTPARTVIVW